MKLANSTQLEPMEGSEASIHGTVFEKHGECIEIRKSWPLIDVVLWAPKAAASVVHGAYQTGAKAVVVSQKDAQLVDAVQQILDAQQLLPMVEKRARQRVQGSRFEAMLSRTSAMWDLFALCARIAASNARVLIVGETGTGKELFARALHRRSGLSGRFVAAYCASIRPELIESSHTAAKAESPRNRQERFQIVQNN